MNILKKVKLGQKVVSKENPEYGVGTITARDDSGYYEVEFDHYIVPIIYVYHVATERLRKTKEFNCEWFKKSELKEFK